MPFQERAGDLTRQFESDATRGEKDKERERNLRYISVGAVQIEVHRDMESKKGEQ